MRRALRRIGIGLLAAVLLLLGGLWAIDTSPGHRLLADRIAALRPPTGLRIRIGRIDGSIWGRATLRDVRLSDTRGVFLEAPEIRLDWRPLAWARNRLDIRSATSDLVMLQRLPVLRSTRQPATLPGFDIALGRLSVGTLRLGPGVAGRATAARLDARADLRDRRALIDLGLSTRLGDRLRLHLDAAPDADRFELAGGLAAPAGGVVGGLAGIARPLSLDIGGRGSWTVWNGQARAALSGRPILALALGVRDGRVLLQGRAAPARLLQGKLQRLTAPLVRLRGEGRLQDRQFSGALKIDSAALRLVARGRLDLAEGAFAPLELDGTLARPAALFPNMSGRDLRLLARMDGPFRTPAVRYRLTATRLAFDATGFEAVRAEGATRLGESPLPLPLSLSAARVTGLGEEAGGILRNLRVAGTLALTSRTLAGRRLSLTSDQLSGRLDLALDLLTGRYDIALNGGLRRYLIPGLGIVEVQSELTAVPGAGGIGTVVAGRGRARVLRLDNAFFAGLAGGLPRIDTRLVRDTAGVLHFTDLVLAAPDIRVAGRGLRRKDGTFLFSGRGQQRQYGPFTIELDGNIAKPAVRLVFDRPLDALGLAAVRLALDPIAEGFAFTAAGSSTLGPFTGKGRILLPAGQPSTIDIAALDVTGTRASGALRSDPGGFTGTLTLTGGGLSGRIGFAPQGSVQRIDVAVGAEGARLAAATPVALRRGRVDGTLLLDPAGVGVSGRATALGVRAGALSLGRLAVDAQLRGGVGRVNALLAGSRGRAFRLSGGADLAPGRVTVSGGGTLDGQPLTLTEPARLVADGPGWRLLPAKLTFGSGAATVAGRFGGAATAVDLAMERLPLTLLDLAAPGMGLGGAVSGGVAYTQAAGSDRPTARADLTVRGLTRAGLVLTSTPVDIGLALRLDAAGLAARGVATSGGKTVGRAQMRVAPLGPGPVGSALPRAPLFAQLRWNGPADALWRLTGIETIDLSGPLSLAADAGGTLADPQIRGLVRTSGARLESAVTGTVVERIEASGRFDGARLRLDRIAGGTAEGGTIAGTGDLAFSAERGFGMDLRLQTTRAQLLNRDDLGATVTGPLQIRSDASGGLISGDLVLDRSRFRLGRAVAAEVPRLKVSELNRPADELAEEAPVAPWRLDVKASARNRLTVTGLGLDSEWRADLTLGGAVDNPAIGGRVDLVRGGYEFAGRRFDLERGSIRFTGAAPPDPIIDIVARANVSGINAAVRVTGTGLRPDIAFESTPALPEDELLSRILFGTSITNLSAPEALQLASAVASLRSGGQGGGLGLDLINAIRRATGLDRLRILPADAATGQRTSVAAGKYIGRRTYVELITDGAGYSATRVEFQITRWLSLLSTISTVGRQSGNVRVSRDY